jgi:3'-phosphoadenosine 5'-phosphosulfate sulfotransferase
MPFLAFLLFVTVSSGVELVNQVYQVPANDWRYIDLGVKRRPAIVKASFRVQDGPAVRVMLMSSRDLGRMSHGQPYAPMGSTAAVRAGSFEIRVMPSTDAVVAIENRDAHQAANVSLTILLDFGDATQLSPERKLTVVAISCAVFLGMVGFSAMKLRWAAKPRV